MGCKKAGKYKIVLNSDREEYGGWNNVNSDAEFFASEWQHDNRPASFQVRRALLQKGRNTCTCSCFVVGRVPCAGGTTRM